MELGSRADEPCAQVNAVALMRAANPKGRSIRADISLDTKEALI